MGSCPFLFSKPRKLAALVDVALLHGQGLDLSPGPHHLQRDAHVCVMLHATPAEAVHALSAVQAQPPSCPGLLCRPHQAVPDSACSNASSKLLVIGE
jgi:hypothetical protein